MSRVMQLRIGAELTQRKVAIELAGVTIIHYSPKKARDLADIIKAAHGRAQSVTIEFEGVGSVTLQPENVSEFAETLLKYADRVETGWMP